MAKLTGKNVGTAACTGLDWTYQQNGGISSHGYCGAEHGLLYQIASLQKKGDKEGIQEGYNI